MTKSNKVYVIHHGDGCTDGLGAKYAAWKKFKDTAIYIPASYKDKPPEIESGSEVYIADFSYSRDFLRDLYARSEILKVLDHHKSAAEELQGEPYATFDMNKSGAVLAWEYFHPEEKIPEFFLRIQDRDIWTWKFQDTKDILNGFSVLPQTVETIDSIAFNPSITEKSALEYLKETGSSVSLYTQQQVDKIIESNAVRFMNYKGHEIAIVNSNTQASEIANNLCVKFDLDYAIVWKLDKDGCVSLNFRSDNQGKNFDVSELAKFFNGGGHRNAAGGRTNLEWVEAMYGVFNE
jgi:oligoribonuclease NrnB/cAMP/cGMP phosphodiesterase (DHH superfamily)